MCRLFAYVHTGSTPSPDAALGHPIIDEFRQLAEVHRDGWGAVWGASNNLSAYHSTLSASRDVGFESLVHRPIGSMIIHERLASPGIGLSLDNQQPFTFGGLAFAHNGTLGNAEGNIVGRPTSYRQGLGLVHSTTGSDSRLYAELFIHHLSGLGADAEGPTVDQVCRALGQTVERLRQDYPEASFNNVVETPKFTLATCAHPDDPQVSEGLRRLYDKAGWHDRLETYFDLGYTTLVHGDQSRTSVVSSSGYPSWDSWTRVPNNAVVVLSHLDASVQVLPLC